MSTKYQSHSEKQTYNVGKKFAQKLKGGEVLALSGQLGAGKTVFTKGLAAGLGIKKIITSPTFVLMKVYWPPVKQKIKTMVHIDCYRLTDPKQLIDIGAADYFGQKDTITVIEWAEKVKKILPRQTKKILLKLINQNKREIIIK